MLLFYVYAWIKYCNLAWPVSFYDSPREFIRSTNNKNTGVGEREDKLNNFGQTCQWLRHNFVSFYSCPPLVYLYISRVNNHHWFQNSVLAYWVTGKCGKIQNFSEWIRTSRSANSSIHIPMTNLAWIPDNHYLLLATCFSCSLPDCKLLLKAFQGNFDYQGWYGWRSCLVRWSVNELVMVEHLH